MVNGHTIKGHNSATFFSFLPPFSVGINTLRDEFAATGANYINISKFLDNDMSRCKCTSGDSRGRVWAGGVK